MIAFLLGLTVGLVIAVVTGYSYWMIGQRNVYREQIRKIKGEPKP